MKIGNFMAGAVRQVVKSVASTGRTELKNAGKSMLGQVAYGKHTSFQTQAPVQHKTYESYSARGQTKKFGLNLISQVSGKNLSYQELQEVQAANDGVGSTPHDILRSKINQMYQTHAKRVEQQKAATQQEAEQTREDTFREEGQRSANLSNVNRAIAKTRPEIGKNFGGE